MSARVIKQRGRKAAEKHDSRVIALIILAVFGPLLLTYLLIETDMRSDLSEITPRQPKSQEGAELVGWKDLDASDEAGRHRRVEIPNGPVRMIGYMMDGYQPVRDGTAVSMFMLMPEAGQLLHPAHRTPDEMVEVWLKSDRSVNYIDRSLVWVTGNLKRIRQKPKEGLASYAINEGVVDRATPRDITRLFTP